MKSIYALCLMLITINVGAQSRISKVNTTQTKEPSLNERRIQTKRVQNEIDAKAMSLKIIGKAIFPYEYKFKFEKLKLNGAGLRQGMYACGLYLQAKNSVASKIVSSNEIMVIRLDILSNATSKKKLIKELEKGFQKSNTEAVVLEFKKEFEDFVNFLDIDIKAGYKYDIVYKPGLGTSLYVNYIKKGTIMGLPFKSAIFNIWLSDIEPADEKLKQNLLSL